MPYAGSGGARIYWETRGEGAPILLILGLGAVLEQWHRLEPALSSRFQTILFDNRGLGRSDAPPGPYSIECMADDAAAVLEAAGVSRAHVLGMSMGGMIAQELVLRRPGLVRSLVLACTTCGGTAGVLASPEVRASLNPNPALSRDQIFWLTTEFIYAADTPRAALAADLAARLRGRRTLEGYVGQLGAVKAWKGTYDRLHGVGVPTLVIHGDVDRLIPPDNGRILARSIPGARLVMLSGAAHIFLTDRFEPARDAIVSFLETAGGPPGS
jgi:3-oxoadipate enol-lactonase